jgi:hypothetical protein
VKRQGVVPVLVIATLLLTSSTSGAISVKTAAKQYQEDVASANAALKTFDSEIDAWTNATPDAEGERQAASVLTLLETLRKSLQGQSWPKFVKGDIRFICAEDISSLQEDLHEIDSNSSLGNGAFQWTFRADTWVTNLDASNIRRDLGLPRSWAL